MMRDDAPPGARAEPTDRQLVERVLGGDRDCYRYVVRRYQNMLYRHALYMTGEPDVAADLVQGALVKAYASIGKCRDRDRFGAWLFRILANACKDYLKSRRRRDVSLEAAKFVPETSSNPATEFERVEVRSRLNGALARLPETLRQAFIMKHVEGMSYEEIATLTRTSVPALKMRVHRAREILKELLADIR